MSEWQPIEMAPRDRVLLVYDPKEGTSLVAYWHARHGEWIMVAAFHNEWQPTPTHWMPLPTPPVT